MNSRHRKTLEIILHDPVPRHLEWRRVERLLVAMGCDMIEESGSRVGFRYGDLRADFHRPHPGKEALPYQIRPVREFLTAAGLK